MNVKKTDATTGVSYGATALLLHVCEEGHEGYIVQNN